MQSINHDLLVRYLLGDLSAPEREQVEQEYFFNQETWEALKELEGDLIDSYVRGGLAKRQRSQFEGYFLRFPGRQERVAVATCLAYPVLRESFAAPAPQRPQPADARRSGPKLWSPHPRWAFSWAAVALTAGIVAAFLAAQNRSLRGQLEGLQSAQTELQRQGPGQRMEAHDSGGPPKAEIAQASTGLLLEPGISRSGAGNTPRILPVPDRPSPVVLLLDLARDNYSQYDAALETAEGRVIQRVSGLKSQPIPNGKIVIVVFLSQVFEKGQYIVRLSGTGQRQPFDSYMFSAVPAGG